MNCRILTMLIRVFGVECDNSRSDPEIPGAIPEVPGGKNPIRDRGTRFPWGTGPFAIHTGGTVYRGQTVNCRILTMFNRVFGVECDNSLSDPAHAERSLRGQVRSRLIR